MKKYSMISNRRLHIFTLFLSVIAVILEALPIGAVAYFSVAPHESKRVLFSYFNGTLWGYANIFPMLTAVFTCVIVLLCLFALITGKGGLNKSAMILSLIAFVTSIAPPIFFTDIRLVSFAGVIISVLILAVFLICGFIYVKNRKTSRPAGNEQ